MARYLVSVGTAENKVGPALQEVGKLLGIHVERTMSQRTVQRAVLEGGVAADIQLGYEMTASDSEISVQTRRHTRTSNTNPDQLPLGVGTSVDHTSETQVEGLIARLREIAEVFNASPLAKRENLYFHPDEFARRLLGTSGDHAADQKKSHALLGEWRLVVICRRLGEEAVFKNGDAFFVSRLLILKVEQIQELGGQEEWDRLSEAEKAAMDATIIGRVGLEVFEHLPAIDRAKMTRFIRTGG